MIVQCFYRSGKDVKNKNFGDKLFKHNFDLNVTSIARMA